MRIGAKALDCLPVLKQAKGVNFYRDYPEVSMSDCNLVLELIMTQEEDQNLDDPDIGFFFVISM